MVAEEEVRVLAIDSPLPVAHMEGRPASEGRYVPTTANHI